MKKNDLAAFEDRKIRRVWVEKEEKWYFSVIDVIEILSESNLPKRYWSDLKKKLRNEGFVQVYDKIVRFKLESIDKKIRETDCADTETIFRLIQSIPSPKAEPFKLWLARVGYERVEENDDPEKSIQRAMAVYLRKGYSKDWVDLRLKSIEIRKDLTNEWNERGVRTNDEFAILTDDITSAWAGMRTHEYKKYKDLKKENLRDNMTNLELVLNMLAEASTTEISKKDLPDTFMENRKVARRGGSVAGVARRQLEKQTGESIITKMRRLK